MRAVVLSSDSNGNAIALDTGAGVILLDCGISARKVFSLLPCYGVDPLKMRAVCVSHNHGDHSRGVKGLLWAMPGVVLYCSAATMEAISLPDHVDFCPANASYGITKCETGSSVLMSSFPVPHDAEDARGFVIKIVGSTKVGYLVDAGYVSEAMAEALEGCETVFMESNHDEKMLEECERHPSVKIRVAGCRGHLSNRVVSDLIERLACSGLKRAVLCHLSHEANTPELAKATIQRANTNVEILVARPGLSVDF